LQAACSGHDQCRDTTDRHISPLGLMCLQGEEMKKETKINAKNIEEEFQFHGLQSRQITTRILKLREKLSSVHTAASHFTSNGQYLYIWNKQMYAERQKERDCG
jgi:hypothetical protein